MLQEKLKKVTWPSKQHLSQPTLGRLTLCKTRNMTSTSGRTLATLGIGNIRSDWYSIKFSVKCNLCQYSTHWKLGLILTNWDFLIATIRLLRFLNIIALFLFARFWFYFSIENTQADQRIIFNLVNISKSRNLLTNGLTPVVKSTSRYVSPA